MRPTRNLLGFAALLAAALGAAPALYANDNQGPSSSMMGGGMMGRGSMGGMTGRMGRMMDHCGTMMQGGRGNGRPNDQWRRNPQSPDGDDKR